MSRKSFVGHKKYAAPEILKKSYLNYNYKIDIFTLGCTRFNMMNPNEIEGQDKN